MKRTTLLTVALACGLLARACPARRPGAPAGAGRSGPTGSPAAPRCICSAATTSPRRSSRNTATCPKGVSMPVFTSRGSQDGNDFALFGQNISQTRPALHRAGRTGWLGVAFDYNQIPHSMGNDGRSIMTDSAPGVWGMSATLRQALGDGGQCAAADRGRATMPFFSALYAPTIASASSSISTRQRKRGNVEVGLGRRPAVRPDVDLPARASRRARAAPAAATIRGFVDNIVEVPEPLNEVTQDVGFRLALNQPWGNVHAAFHHNWYNDRQETLVVDNPLVAVRPALSRGGRARFRPPAARRGRASSTRPTTRPAPGRSARR